MAATTKTASRDSLKITVNEAKNAVLIAIVVVDIEYPGYMLTNHLVRSRVIFLSPFFETLLNHPLYVVTNSLLFCCLLRWTYSF